jgi:hypothetical protein
MKSILLGHREDQDQGGVKIDPQQRSTHMHIIGSTGTGKSKFIEHLVREDILQNNGLCLIDPHGYLYNDLVCWCETYRMFGRKKIILFDPSQENWSFCFNPFKIDSEEISYHVDKMAQATAQVWGGEDTNKTPLLKRNLRMIFQVLAEKNLSLLEAMLLLDSTDPAARKYLTRELSNSEIKKLWDYANTLKPRPFMDEFGSAVNRMMEFLSSPIIKNTIGVIEQAIDFRAVMDEGAVLLVNLAAKGRLSDDNARLLGTLIVNDLFMKCQSRPEGSRPFYLYIDECARFINDDVARILDEGRKFGLHLILAHQHLAQLEEVSPKVYRSVMTDAKTKVVFGGLAAQDARILAENIFAGELELQEVKEVLDKPVAVGYIKEMVHNFGGSKTETYGKSVGRIRSRQVITASGEATGSGWGVSQGQIISDGMGQQTGQLFDLGAGPLEITQSMGQSFSSMRGISKSQIRSGSRIQQFSIAHGEGEGEIETESRQSANGENWGEGETFVPVLEERPSSTYSLEEQISKAMWVMMNQPAQYAIIKIGNYPSQAVKTPNVASGYANPNRVQRFKQDTFQKTYFAKPKGEVEKIIANRLERIVKKAQEEKEAEGEGGKPEKKDPPSFRG